MRVVYLSGSGQSGGAETSMLELLAALRKGRPGWQLSVVLPAAGPLEPRIAALGVDVDVLPFPAQLARLGDAGFSLAKLPGAVCALRHYVSGLKALLRARDPHVVHANGLKMHIIGAWANPGRALVWHIHDFMGRRRLGRRMLRWHASRCSLAICNSRSVAADMRAACGQVPCRVIYNAVDPARFCPEGPTADLDALSRLPAAPPGTHRIGLLSTFARWKGHSVFLQALARVARQFPVRGYIIGAPIYQTDGSQRTFEDLRREADALGLNGLIGFTGFVEDSPSALRALDIAVHASTEPEPFGMAIVEAMACRKPVVAALAGGAAEILQHEETGLGHRPGDAGGLAEQLVRLVGNQALALRLSHAGRRLVERAFCPERMIERIVPTYEGLLAA